MKLMKILRKNIDMVTLCLKAGQAMQREWMAFDDNRRSLTPKGMHLFEFRREAAAHCKEWQRYFTDWQVVPASRLLNTIESIIKLQQQRLIEPSHIRIDAKAILNSYEAKIKPLEKSDSLTIKNKTMNEKNFEYLKDNLKYLGFGEKQNEALEQHLKEGKESFQLTFDADVNKKPFEAVLQFRKSDNSDMYFFNSYHASLERNNGEKVEQPFYLNKGKGVTAKEAYNLLEGRAVHKELNNKDGEPYKAWIQLDFENKDKHDNNEVKQFHENYGYDLKAAVGKYAVAELDGAEKEKTLMQSLQKGNIQSVTIEKNGESHKMFMEANPQYKTVNLYDSGMKRMQKESLEQYQSIVPSQDKAVKQQQEVKSGMKQGKEVKNGKVQKDDSLLPKKRTRQKKGLGLK